MSEGKVGDGFSNLTILEDLGGYADKGEAIKIRRDAEIKYFGEYRCGGVMA